MNSIEILNGHIHELPPDIFQHLSQDETLILTWNQLTPIQRNEWICWIELAKMLKTRQNRITRMITELKEGKKRSCCWPGCPHHNSKFQKYYKK